MVENLLRFFVFQLNTILRLLRLSVFSVLVTTYVDAIRNGAVPCVENAIKSLALIENSKAVETALQQYKDQMNSGLKLPTRNDQTLNDHHFQCLRNAVKRFLELAVLDEDNEFQKELNVSSPGLTCGHFKKKKSENS